jgi:hypothetical protein
MAAKTEWCGEEIRKGEIASTSERDGALYITVNVLSVMPTREVQVGLKGTERVSSHYWLNSLPFVKQSS